MKNKLCEILVAFKSICIFEPCDILNIFSNDNLHHNKLFAGGRSLSIIEDVAVINASGFFLSSKFCDK